MHIFRYHSRFRELFQLVYIIKNTRDTTAEEKKEVLEQDFGIPMTKKMEGEVEYMCNLSDGVEQRGIQQGVEQTKIKTVINMLKENEPIDKICRIAECDEEFVERVKKEM